MVGLALENSTALADDVTVTDNNTDTTANISQRTSDQKETIRLKSNDSTVNAKTAESLTDAKTTSKGDAGKITATQDNNQTDTTTVPETASPKTFNSINGNAYYYGKNGKLYRDQFYENRDHTYYFGKDGAR